MRSRDPRVQKTIVDTIVEEYEQYFRDLASDLEDGTYWQARYSRGDALHDLESVFAGLLDQRDKQLATTRKRYQKPEAVLYDFRDQQGHARYVGIYYRALVQIAVARCLHMPSPRVMGFVVRGDRLLETIAGGSLAQRTDVLDDNFRARFGLLYDAISAPPAARGAILAEYLREWRDLWADGLVLDLPDRPIGDWCFEAAGLVVALDIDDRELADHPHYPVDLVRWARATPQPTVDEPPIVLPTPLPKYESPPPAQRTKPLSPDEQALLTAYRSAVAALDRTALRRLLSLLSNGSDAPIGAAWSALEASWARSDPEYLPGHPDGFHRSWIETAVHTLGDNDGMLVLDWKAGDQVLWSCRKLANVPFATEFRWRQGPRDGVTEGLAAFDTLARQHGHRVVGIESLSDSYWAAVVPDADVAELTALARRFGTVVGTSR